MKNFSNTIDNTDEEVLVGPDLNDSKPLLDKKKYRQIILKKNGLRVLLISDVSALGNMDSFDEQSNVDQNDSEDNSDEFEDLTADDEIYEQEKVQALDCTTLLCINR